MIPLNKSSQVHQESGLLTVGRKVVLGVAHRTASDVPGVVQLGGDSIWKKLLRWLGFKPSVRGIELELADGEAAMTITIVVRMGARIPEIAAEIRRRVKKALKDQLGIEVRTVNVTVASVKAAASAPSDERPQVPIEDVDPSAVRRRPRFDFEDEAPL